MSQAPDAVLTLCSCLYCSRRLYPAAVRDLCGATFKSVTLKNAKFRFCTLICANFSGSDLEFADFTGANMIGACLSFSFLRGVTAPGATLEHSIAISCQAHPNFANKFDPAKAIPQQKDYDDEKLWEKATKVSMHHLPENWERLPPRLVRVRSGKDLEKDWQQKVGTGPAWEKLDEAGKKDKVRILAARDKLAEKMAERQKKTGEEAILKKHVQRCVDGKAMKGE